MQLVSIPLSTAERLRVSILWMESDFRSKAFIPLRNANLFAASQVEASVLAIHQALLPGLAFGLYCSWRVAS